MFLKGNLFCLNAFLSRAILKSVSSLLVFLSFKSLHLPLRHPLFRKFIMLLINHLYENIRNSLNGFIFFKYFPNGSLRKAF